MRAADRCAYNGERCAHSPQLGIACRDQTRRRRLLSQLGGLRFNLRSRSRLKRSRRHSHSCLRRGWRRWDQRSLILPVRLRRSISRSSHGSDSRTGTGAGTGASRIRSSRSNRSRGAGSSSALFHAHRRSVDGSVGVGFRDRVRHGCRTTSLHGRTCGGSRKPTPAGPLPGASTAGSKALKL